MPMNVPRFLARMRELRSFGYSQEWALRRATEEEADANAAPSLSPRSVQEAEDTIAQKREELAYEMKRVAGGSAAGAVSGIPGVFRCDGLTLEQMADKLRELPEYQHIRHVDDLVDLLHMTLFGSDMLSAQGVPPSPKQLREKLGIDTSVAWWKESWRKPD